MLARAWARMKLNAHNLLHVTASVIISSILTWMQMIFYVNHMFIKTIILEFGCAIVSL